MDDQTRWFIAMLSGTDMRLSEATGLLSSDIKLDCNLPNIQFVPHPWRRLKTPSSIRQIPIVGASFWAAQRIKASGHKLAFPKSCSELRCNSNLASAALNKWLKPRTKGRCVIQSFRHGLRERLRAVERPVDIIDAIGGWNTDGVGQAYGKGHALQIKSKYIFYSDFLPRINNLSGIKFIVLKKEIKSEIEKWCLKYNLNKEFLGVHVRHTDKTPIKSINYLVDMIKEKHSSLSIFLSTDSHEVEKKFKIEFKDKLLIYPKEINNKGNNKRGIHMWGLDNKNDTYKREMLRFSIIDMWLLSKCKFLIFQSNSSFSLFSKYLMSENQNSYGW